MMTTAQQQIRGRLTQRAMAAGFDLAAIAEGYRISDVGKCRSCEAPVLWLITPKGARMPWSLGGVSHFADCPTAAEHRKPR